MTDEEFEHLQAALEAHGRTAAAISGDLEDGINADRLLATAERDGLLAALAEAEADRDRARKIAVALEQEVAAVRELHSPFKIYEPCSHEHEETDEGVVNAIEIGPVCEDGFMYTICRHCCTDGNSDQTEKCVSEHDHSESVCPTNAALDGGEG